MQPTMLTAAIFCSALLPLFVYVSSAAAPAPVTSASSEEGNGGVDVLAFFVVALVIGVATYHVLAVTKIPYTALLIVWGVVLGIANETYDINWNLLGPGTQAWETINPNLLLTVFLPVLLFAAAFGLEWQYIRRLIGSGLLLAGPGVLFGASITAVLVKYSFPYDWSWVECLLFGAIFSATDPVAVVAVLKETGMPKKVRTLVDLEALLNDGTAYVLFVLLQNWAEGKHQSAGDAIRLFFQLSAGGPATGIAFGLAMTLWLRFMYNKPLAEISLTIAAAYGTYIVANELFGVSPVLAVVFLGLWMAAKGFNHVSRKVEHPLHVIWEELEFVANTLVFILAGVVIAGRIYESSHDGSHLIQAQDWGYALLLWVYLTVIRAAMLVAFWPLLNSWGYVITSREAVVLCWSGLRGAVGLSLALFILLDGNISDLRYRTLTFFHMGCVAFLTIIFQGTSMKPLLQAMNMTKPSSVKRTFLNHVLKQVEEHGEEQLRFARYDRVLGDPDWQRVYRIADLEPAALLKRYASKLSSPNASAADLDMHMTRLAHKMNRNLLVREKRSRLLLAVRQTYNDFFQDHYVSTSQVVDLRLSADKALDHLDQRLNDWGHLQAACRIPKAVLFAQRWTKSDGVAGKFAQHALALALEKAAILALAFCHSHQLAVQDMVQYEKLEEWGPEDDFGAGHMGLAADTALEHMKHNVTEQILMESKAEVEEAYAFIGDLRDAFPEVLKGIKTAQLAQEMLIYKEEYIDEIGRTGLLEETELEQMVELVEYKLSNLHFFPPRFQWPSAATLLAEHPMFQDLPKEAFREEVLRHVSIRVHTEGKLLHGIAKPVEEATILLRGKASLEPPGLFKDSINSTIASSTHNRSRLSKNGIVAHAGAVLGCWPMLLKTTCPFNITAASICLVATIPQDVLQRLMRKYGDVQAIAWQSAGAALALLHGGPQLAGYDYNALVKIFRHARVESREAGQQLRVAGSAMLAVGRLRRLVKAHVGADNDQPIEEGPSLLSSEPGLYSCHSHVKVLHLPGALDLAAMDKVGDKMARSALAELVQPHSRLVDGDVESALNLSRLSAPNFGSRAEEWPEGSTDPDQGHVPLHDVAASGLQSDAEVSMSQNRRKSLAHGLLIHGLANKPSAGTLANKSSAGSLNRNSSMDMDGSEHPDRANTLSGATGAQLLREWQAYKQRQQLPARPAPEGMRRQASADLGVSPSEPRPPDGLSRRASPATGLAQASSQSPSSKPRVSFASQPPSGPAPPSGQEAAALWRLTSRSAPALPPQPAHRQPREQRQETLDESKVSPGVEAENAVRGPEQARTQASGDFSAGATQDLLPPQAGRPAGQPLAKQESCRPSRAASTQGSSLSQDLVPEDLPLRRQVLRSISRGSSSLDRGRPALRRKSFLKGLRDPTDTSGQIPEESPEL